MKNNSQMESTQAGLYFSTKTRRFEKINNKNSPAANPQKKKEPHQKQEKI